VARKVTPRKRPAKNAGRDDLQVIAPDRTLRIDGRDVIVREYRFLEGLRLQAVAEPLVAQLAELALQEQSLPPEKLDAVIAQHPEDVVQMIALACDQPADWVANLHGVPAENLFAAWWTVNAGFFVRRVQQRVLQRQMQASAGRVSSSPSPAIPPTSGASPKPAPAVN
jgi:hypothetical protein